MAAPTLAFLQIDALVPLPGASDVKEGFTRVPLTLCPPFSAQARPFRSTHPAAAAPPPCAPRRVATMPRRATQPGRSPAIHPPAANCNC